MLKFVVFVILAVLAPSFALISDFNLIQCPGIPLPKDVSVDECPNGNPCNIHVGDTINVYDTVVLNEPVTGLIRFIGIARANNGEIIFQDISPDACTVIEGGCPLKPGEYTIKNQYQIKGVPNENFSYVSTIWDQDHKPISCYSVIDQLIP